MQKTVRKAWNEYVQPLLYRPPQVQVAALPVRGKGKDKTDRQAAQRKRH
jgi:hypothetical protein